MSGFEIVGTSIAITRHLQSYLQKRSPFSYPAEGDFIQADGCLVELNTQLALIHNVILITLAEVIDEDDLVELLRDLNGKTWKSPLIKSKAKGALGDLYQPFWTQSLQLRVCLNGLCEIFDLRVPSPAEGLENPPSPLADHPHTQKREYSTPEIANISAALKEINGQLRQIAGSFHIKPEGSKGLE
ncbi:hypothetical protein BJX61DRAFT_501566 [Aspergillus egyptiacus]|nr:hypothetical protein BJX61DRAFT_501566 [Aspergillus egyptiacus]